MAQDARPFENQGSQYQAETAATTPQLNNDEIGIGNVDSTSTVYMSDSDQTEGLYGAPSMSVDE